MTEERKRKEVRNWRARKITLYIACLAVIIIGAVVMIQGALTDPLEDTWKFIAGFIICAAGTFSMIDTYHWKFKDFLSKKMKKAR